jgi:hypothetical protein
MNVEDPKRAGKEKGTTLSAGLPWEAFGALAILILLVGNELLPILLRHRDWSFVYVTLRAIVVPVSSLVVGLSSVLGLMFSRRRAVLVRSRSVLICGTAIYLSWVYQMPLFFRL